MGMKAGVHLRRDLDMHDHGFVIAVWHIEAFQNGSRDGLRHGILRSGEIARIIAELPGRSHITQDRVALWLSASRTRRDGATRDPSRCVLSARGRAIGT